MVDTVRLVCGQADIGMDGRTMNLKELIGLLPPVAIYNIIARSIEADQHSRERVISAAVGWKPDETYQEHVNGDGEKEYYKVIREAKDD